MLAFLKGVIIFADFFDKPEIWAPIIVSILSLLGVGTFTSLFWKDRFEQKKEKRIRESDEAKAAAKAERQEEMREVTNECWAQVENKLNLVADNFTSIDTRLKDIKENLDLNSTGTQAGLRNHLLNCYYNCKKKGYRTQHDSENFRDLYEAYHALGGNSFIDKDVKVWFEKLPSKEDFLNNNSKKGE